MQRLWQLDFPPRDGANTRSDWPYAGIRAAARQEADRWDGPPSWMNAHGSGPGRTGSAPMAARWTFTDIGQDFRVVSFMLDGT